MLRVMLADVTEVYLKYFIILLNMYMKARFKVACPRKSHELVIHVEDMKHRNVFALQYRTS